MSDKKPEKIVEPSPFDKFMEELREWRAGRDKRQSAKRLNKAEHFNETRQYHQPVQHPVAINIFNSVGWFFGIIVELILGLFSLFFGLFRFAIYIAVVGGFIWLFMMVEVGDATVDEARDEIKEQASEVTKKVGDKVGSVIQSLSDEIGKITKNWHIEIRTTGEDGEEKVIEFGTKKDEPEAPE
jgi:hypothetical protein